MLRHLCLLLLTSTLLQSMSFATSAQSVHHLQRTVTRTVGYTYLLAFPEGYDPKGDRVWPVLFFLHGSGERGDDAWSAARHGPPKFRRDGRLHSREQEAAELVAKNFIVVSPQCPKNAWWETESLLAVLDEVLETHRADAGRVYLTGLSMGGYGAWALGMAHPERFAAMVPVCGGGEFASAFMSLTHKRSALRSLGVWAFHGAKDPRVPVAESERMIEMLKYMGARNVHLTVYPDAKHDAWSSTYANPEVYRWLLRHAREKRTARR